MSLFNAWVGDCGDYVAIINRKVFEQKIFVTNL